MDRTARRSTARPRGPVRNCHEPSVDGLPADGYPVGQKPYEQTLTVNVVCPGVDVKDILANPGTYRAVVIMSVQGAGMPKDTKTPLWQAVATPTSAG